MKPYLNLEMIEAIIADWNNGYLAGQLREKYNLTEEQKFAITMCTDEMMPEEMLIKLMNLEKGMKAKEILEAMRK